MSRQLLHSMAVVGAIVLAASGCGGGEKKGVKVTGSVMVDSTPQSAVSVGFIPVEVPDNHGSIGAVTDTAGKFETQLLPGKYKVILSQFVDQAGNVPGPDVDIGQLEAAGSLQQAIPSAYTDPGTTPLSAEIPPEGKDLSPFEVMK